MSVIAFTKREYAAKLFEEETIHGTWQAAGTLCGHIDFVIPQICTHSISPDEALQIVNMLTAARKDVLENSRTFDDQRLYDGDRP
jgi:hypothetical protein